LAIKLIVRIGHKKVDITSFLVIFSIILKVVVSVLTPLSGDFFTLVRGAFKFNEVGFAEAVAAGWHFLWVIVLNGFQKIWLALPIDHPSYEEIYLPVQGAYPKFISSFSSNLLIFMMKLPLLFFDILCGLLIYKIVFDLSKDRRKSLISLLLWLYNLYVLLITEMWGAVDVAAIFFTLASMYFLMKNKLLLSAITFFLGTVSKLTAMLFLPLFLVYIFKQNRRQALRYGCYSVLLFLTTYAFIYFLSKGRIAYWTLNPALEYSFLIGSLLSPISGTPIGITLLLFLLYLYMIYNIHVSKPFALIDYTLGYLLIFFSFSYFLPQFFLWVIPFLILDIVLNDRKILYASAYLLVVFLWELIVFGFYFSGRGASVFFIPNYNELMRSISNFIYNLRENNLIKIFYVEIALRSTFTAIGIAYLVRLISSHITSHLKSKADEK
jgi:ABC-type multidrug transport system fused ATPase/permease subunit